MKSKRDYYEKQICLFTFDKSVPSFAHVTDHTGRVQ